MRSITLHKTPCVYILKKNSCFRARWFNRDNTWMR